MVENFPNLAIHKFRFKKLSEPQRGEVQTNSQQGALWSNL